MPYFSNHKLKLHYYQYGTGPEVMLAFHGFGMKGTQFSVLEPAFTQKYTIYSFDLFFHGQTVLHDSSLSVVRKGLSSEEFSSYILEFITQMKLKKISLLSYSIGSLLAFSLIKNIPEYINKAFFIAPDGIKPNKLLQFGSRNKLVNRVFHKLVYRPKTVQFILDKLLRYKYIDQSIHEILLGEFISEQTRLTCYNAITFYAKLNFKQDQLAEILNRHEIESFFYFGTGDKLFPPSIGHHFAKKLKKSSLQVLDADHNLVTPKLTPIIAQQLN
ncbi:alpha/beta fold hydrolase [Pedobacter rhizosphaerae]|uniref:Pimeloyl-ACP methyl ester carboxylesterase n=1 Tax=Pedobacter rhizosphaerae TaxID=390241 RepID=A0A1H9UK09_9SPHI|nr:alpha/beta hydrolase [Pedobacter rhizosphaerae]SES09669.1 Pimeloyl-ACP methyl ester carboxylesterase [Pedobacter rhizosphaerae]